MHENPPPHVRATIVITHRREEIVGRRLAVRRWMQDACVSLLMVFTLAGCASAGPTSVADARPATPPPTTSPTSAVSISGTGMPGPSTVEPVLVEALASARPGTPEVTRVPTPTSTLPPTSPTTNPFAILTALALTPTRPRDPPVRPLRLTIPRIGLDAPVFPVGTDRQGVPIVLKHNVGWFDQSGKPAGGTNIVFWAHVLRFKDSPNIPAPFANVDQLQPRDRISVTNTMGRIYRYVVIAQIRVRPDQVEYLAPTPLERVVLVSCIGADIIVHGELTKTHRLVTIAEPIQ